MLQLQCETSIQLKLPSMSDVLNQSEQFEPIHAAHAIEQVVFVLQFDDALNDASFLEVREAARQFKTPEDLPGQAEIQGFSIAIGSPMATPPSSLGVGIVLHRIGPDGSVENELRVERTSISFRTSLYSRWDAVWSRATKYFQALVPIYARQARLIGISLNFVDKFAWAGGLNECRPGLLLQAKSKYLCGHIFEAKDLWHSHTGAFIEIDKNTKRLLNINVDYLDENRPEGLRRIVAITTVMTDLLDQPGYEPYAMEDKDIIGFVDAHMEGLHVFGKEVLGNIINDEMSRRIALIE